MLRAILALASILFAGTANAQSWLPPHTNSATLVATAVSEQYTNFTWTFAGYDDEFFSVGWDIPVSNAVIRFSTTRNGASIWDITNRAGAQIASGAKIATNFYSRTNLSLTAGSYYVEVLGYTTTNFTESPSRILGKGKARFYFSLLSLTNYTSGSVTND
jgi:hypothetical protein